MSLEVSYRDVERTDSIDTLIKEKLEKLEQVCDNITTCRIAIERPHSFVRSGNQFRVRIEIAVPPGHAVVVTREPGDSNMHQPLPAIIRDAFNAARRQLKKLVDKQKKEVKSHPQQEMGAYIVRLFKEDGYGFIRAMDGHEVYFHQNSVLNDGWNRIEPGTAVMFFEEMGEKGPQASTVQIIDSSGTQIVDPTEVLNNNNNNDIQ
ncbi:MAG: HPF/RaiA family ribosome-associated protein [Bacillota bacterium]